MIKAIIFDFDGTLVDSMPFLENNAIRVLTKHLRISEEEARTSYRKTTGLPFVQQVEIIAPNNGKNGTMVNEFEELKLKRIYEQQIFPETIPVLKQLKEKKYIIAISSGTFESIIKEYLRRKGISSYLDSIMGWKDGFEKGKDHFDFIKKRYSLKAEEILFVGDSLNDAKRALSNNIKFIARTGMFNENDFHEISTDIKIITSLNELEELIDKL